MAYQLGRMTMAGHPEVGTQSSRRAGAAQVRTSNQGWEAGGSLPGRRECVYIDALMPLWARWGGEASGRGAAMPHIKTYCRYRGDRCPPAAAALSPASVCGLTVRCQPAAAALPLVLT